MYRNNQNLKHNNTMEKNSITENDIRATLSGGRNISKPKFIVLLILLCICFLGILASGVMIAYLITSKKNSRTIYSRVLYRYSFFSFPMGTALFGARLFLYKLKIIQVKNRKRFT